MIKSANFEYSYRLINFFLGIALGVAIFCFVDYIISHFHKDSEHGDGPKNHLKMMILDVALG